MSKYVLSVIFSSKIKILRLFKESVHSYWTWESHNKLSSEKNVLTFLDSVCLNLRNACFNLEGVQSDFNGVKLDFKMSALYLSQTRLDQIADPRVMEHSALDEKFEQLFFYFIIVFYCNFISSEIAGFLCVIFLRGLQQYSFCARRNVAPRVRKSISRGLLRCFTSWILIEYLTYS